MSIPVVVASPELVTKLAEIADAGSVVATLDEQLKAAKETLRRLNEDELPEVAPPGVFAEDILVKVGGEFLSFTRKMHCGVANSEKAAAHQWLDENGFGHMLKRYVTVALGVNSREALAQFDRVLRKLLPHFEFQIIVPPRGDQQLAKFVEYVATEAGIAKPEIDVTTELPGPTLAKFLRAQQKAGRWLPGFFSSHDQFLYQRVPAPPACPSALAPVQKDAEPVHCTVGYEGHAELHTDGVLHWNDAGAIQPWCSVAVDGFHMTDETSDTPHACTLCHEELQ